MDGRNKPVGSETRQSLPSDASSSGHIGTTRHGQPAEPQAPASAADSSSAALPELEAERRVRAFSQRDAERVREFRELIERHAPPKGMIEAIQRLRPDLERAAAEFAGRHPPLKEIFEMVPSKSSDLAIIDAQYRAAAALHPPQARSGAEASLKAAYSRIRFGVSPFRTWADPMPGIFPPLPKSDYQKGYEFEKGRIAAREEERRRQSASADPSHSAAGPPVQEAPPPVPSHAEADGTTSREQRGDQPRSARAPRGAGAFSDRGGTRGLPLPALDALGSAYHALQHRNRNEPITVVQVLQLYGLQGISVNQFTHSSKYVQPTKQQNRSAWQLPKQSGRTGHRVDPVTGRFALHRQWPVSEVMKAISGWIVKLGGQALRDQSS